MKIFQTNDVTLLNFSRGDSINQLVSIHQLPESVWENSFPDLTNGRKPLAKGTYMREINIPVKDNLEPGLFFMDVNFDGEEDLLIDHPGYNRTYYACFDIANGIANITPGILHPMDEYPYSNIVSEEFDYCYTEFDYEEKKIHILDRIGPCHVESWCEMVEESGYIHPVIRVVKREETGLDDIGRYIINYERIDGKLIPVDTIHDIFW